MIKGNYIIFFWLKLNTIVMLNFLVRERCNIKLLLIRKLSLLDFQRRTWMLHVLWYHIFGSTLHSLFHPE